MDRRAWGQAGPGFCRRLPAGLLAPLVIVLGSLLLSACSRSVAPPQTVLARQCLPVGGAREVTLPVSATTPGTLRIRIDERGISTIATLDDAAATESESPVERLGTIVLTAEIRDVAKAGRPETHTVRIRAQDSPDITGEVCVYADLIPAADEARRQAEQSFAAAGRAVHASDWESAFREYLSAARSYDHLHLERRAAIARHALADLAYRRLDRKRDAYALASETISGYARESDPVFVGLLASLQAKALMDMPGSDTHAVADAVRARLLVARRHYEQSRFGVRELARLEILTGFLEYLLDAPDKAQGVFAQAAERCRELQDWDCYAAASQNLALLAEESNNYARALSTYADALRLLPPSLNPKLAVDIWNNLGRLQGVVGLFNASQRSHEAAMKASARLGDCRGVRRSLVRVGTLLAHVGNLADAEGDLERAASLDCPSLLAAADVTSPAAAGVGTRNEPQAAGRYASETRGTRKSGPCAQPLDPGSLAIENKIVVFGSLLTLANTLMLEGEQVEVSRCLEAARAYATDSRSQLRLANARGAALLEQNDSAGARAAFEEGLRVADEGKIPPTYEHRGAAHLGLVRSMLLAGKAADSLPYSHEALQSSVARGDIDRTIASLQLIAAGYRGSGQPAAATHTLQVAADLIEAVPIDELDGEQRATFLSTQHTAFAELTDLFASGSGNDDPAAWSAFNASERGRARSLRYALNQETRNASSDSPPVAKYQQLLREVVGITPDSAGAAASQSGATQAPDALVDKIDRVAQSQGGPADPLDRTQLTKTLARLDATLVEYAVGDRDMFALVISKGAPHVVRLGDNREIANAAADLRDRLRDPETPPSETRSAAERLARLVLWPLKGLLAGTRIIFVPDDALHTVPLAVLPWSEDAREQLLLQHAETTIVPSALFLTRAHSATAAHRDAPHVELIGDPVFRVSDWRRECINKDAGSGSVPRVTRAISDWTESLPRLPGTRTEIATIARLARESRPASRVDTLVGCAAVPTALRKAAGTDIDLLHIATHARIDAQRPRLSALALTPESGTNATASAFGLLDILGLKLTSRLVVLSACETSRGRLLPGEGVLGPAQAFLQAGANAVLASYWRVDDQITSAFMQQFYRYLLTDRLNASAALRKAQMERAAAGTTYEWAAFALYGWPDSSL